MKRLAALIATASLGLAGCATGQQLTPAQIQGVLDAAARAGCSGNFGLHLGGATAAGVSPGSFQGSLDLNGACDPAKAKGPPAPVPGSSPGGLQ